MRMWNVALRGFEILRAMFIIRIEWSFGTGIVGISFRDHRVAMIAVIQFVVVVGVRDGSSAYFDTVVGAGLCFDWTTVALLRCFCHLIG